MSYVLPSPLVYVGRHRCGMPSATISAWRSYRVVCAAVAIGICWPSSLPDAVRLTDTADVLAAYMVAVPDCVRRQF